MPVAPDENRDGDSTLSGQMRTPVLAANVAGNVGMRGVVVGSYRIRGYLGAGGMAAVYLAEHTRIDRRAAVKFLLPEWLGHEEAVRRFFSEARATSSICHPGIVEIFDCAVDASGHAYIVMELLDGESLSDRLARDPDFGTDISRCLEVAKEVAAALGAAHDQGIVHRDLKPGNIFLVRAPGRQLGFRVKVLDFGIAKLLGRSGAVRSQTPSQTRPGYILGTPGYISPEQCNDAGLVDHRTDIYSLGCIVFEMVAGRAPFVGPTIEKLVAHVSQAPPRLRDVRPDVPPALESLVNRMLAKESSQRPASMEAVVSEIATLLGLFPAQTVASSTNRPLPSLTRIVRAPIVLLSGRRLASRFLLLASLLISNELLRLSGYQIEAGAPLAAKSLDTWAPAVSTLRFPFPLQLRSPRFLSPIGGGPAPAAPPITVAPAARSPSGATGRAAPRVRRPTFRPALSDDARKL